RGAGRRCGQRLTAGASFAYDPRRHQRNGQRERRYVVEHAEKAPASRQGLRQMPGSPSRAASRPKVMAQCGWDSVTVDMQHGVQDYHSMVACFQAMDKHPITPLVRVPWNEPGIVGKVLDGGAWGVICPMINNAAEARALASYSLYPPKGKRSNGPIRAGAYGSATPYQKTANDEVLIIPMIETQEAVDNIDAILDVPGISGIYVGPS